MTTEYEQRVIVEIQEWRDRAEGRLSKALTALSKPLTWLARSAPDNLTATVTHAIEGVLRGLVDATRKTYSVDRLLAKASEKSGVSAESLSDLAEADLELMDRLARETFAANKIVAALEGAGLGAGGFFLAAADIAALFGFAARQVQQIGTCYGFDMTEPGNYGLTLQALGAGSLGSSSAKAGALMDLHVTVEAFRAGQSYAKVASQTASGRLAKLVKDQTGRLPKRIARHITKRKLAQVIPIIGAGIGAGFNYWFVSSVAESAYMLARAQRLMNRYPGLEI